MTDQNRTQPQPNQPPHDEGRRERPDDEEPDRFEEKRLNRDRSVVEQANHGLGPQTAGYQPRRRVCALTIALPIVAGVLQTALYSTG